MRPVPVSAVRPAATTASTALVGALNLTITVSSASSVLSPVTVAATVLRVSPAAKVSVPPATVA